MKEFLKFLVFVGAILGIITGILRATKVAEIVATDDRMAPSILAGESVFLWKGSDIDRGDIAVCANPARPGELVMGRVIALTGAEVASDRRGITVDGRVPDRDGQGSTRFPDPLSPTPVDVGYGRKVTFTEWHPFMVRRGFTFQVRPTRVPGGHAYLLADYESASAFDSRSFGTVPVSSCLGEVFMRFKPAAVPISTEPPFDHGYFEFLR